jgi:hypothetical protein
VYSFAARLNLARLTENRRLVSVIWAVVAAASRWMGPGPGRTDMTKATPVMVMWAASVKTSCRWPCWPPPGCDCTDMALAFSCFCRV